jgi:hypothetical protein
VAGPHEHSDGDGFSLTRTPPSTRPRQVLFEVGVEAFESVLSSLERFQVNLQRLYNSQHKGQTVADGVTSSLRRLFEVVDIDNSGQIEQDELKVCRKFIVLVASHTSGCLAVWTCEGGDD